MWHVHGVEHALLEQLFTHPDDVIASASTLKDGDRCTVVRIQARSTGENEAKTATDEAVEHVTDDQTESNVPGVDDSLANSFTFKRYNLKGSLHTAIHMAMRSRARWCWLNGRRLIEAGVPTPMPLACIEERRRRWLRLRSYLLTTFVPGRSLLERVRSGDLSHDQLADLAVQFTHTWRLLGQLRAGHGDMKATNFIVDPQGQLWLIDLDGLRIYRSATLLRRERRNDLARFMKNWQEHPEVAAIFRARIGTG